MSRTFLAFAIVCGLSFVSMGMVGCGETAAVNKSAPTNAGPAPEEGAAATESITVED